MQADFVGLDVGGTKIASAVLTGGELGDIAVDPTELSDQDRLVDQLIAIIERTRTAATKAVGLGVPSIVQFETGTISASVNIPLANLPLRSLLTERVGLPVYIDNDGTCAAFAEAYGDGEQRCEDLIMFTVGTGIGGGLVLNGRPYRGATGAAAELGHQLIGLDLCSGDDHSVLARDGGESAPNSDAGQFGKDIPTAAPEFPQPWSLEVFARGPVLDRFAQQLAQSGKSSMLARELADGKAVAGAELVKAAQAGDQPSIDALAFLGRRLGVGIANAINTFDPFEVVIGGGASVAGELLVGPAREVARQFTVPGVGLKTEIRLARYGQHAGLMGAARVAAFAFGDEERS